MINSSAEVRQYLIEALQLDLVGATPEQVDYIEEIIDQAPSKQYLTGFLVLYGASVEQHANNS
ncbi:helicase-like protein [Calothrix sp. NIES-4071]|nr:helicase-like protein [Calothrix sp. NIES-4071]BAZ56700.1 helicase-like protein [Calothrix sp. NIES-4105]